jgi:septal ring factor EnvC (AmiA/AmiB activator)
MNISEFIDVALAWFGKADAKLAALPDSSTAQVKIAGLESANANLTSQLSAVEADLSTAKQTIGTLSASNEKLIADLAYAEKIINDPKGEIAKRAAVMANEIAARQGVPPVVEQAPKDVPVTTQTKTEAKGFDAVVASIQAQINKLSK